MVFSTDFVNQLLDHLTGNAIYAQPVIHAGLHTSLGEVLAGDYARLPITFLAAQDGIAYTTTPLEFLPTTEWGTVIKIRVYADATGSDWLFDIPLDTPRLLDAFTTLRYAAGEFWFLIPGVVA